jgi:hypothetical protein
MSMRILLFRVSDPYDWRNIYFSSGSADLLVAELQALGTVTVAPFETSEAEVVRLAREHDVLVSSPAPRPGLPPAVDDHPPPSGCPRRTGDGGSVGDRPERIR